MTVTHRTRYRDQRNHHHTLRSVVPVLCVLLPLLLMVGCEQAQIRANRPVTIAIGGATAMRPVLLDLSSEFSKQYPNVTFDITGGDSALGEERLRLKQVDLAASTLISSSVSSDFAPGDRSKQFVRIPIGLDGLAIITHKDNPIENLTLVQLQELYSGRIWNWQELGGNDETVLLVSREDGSGSRAIFDERIMGETPVALTAVVMPTSDEAIEYVANNSGAIGYVSRAFVLDLLKSAETAAAATNTPAPPTTGALANLHLIKVENQLPFTETLQNQSYFLIQPLYLVSTGQPRDMVKRFVDFALSPTGQAIVRRHHQPIR